jgi:hypothetical protein
MVVEISKETHDYFKQKSIRFNEYQKSKEVALLFIDDNEIQSGDVCLFLIVGSILWTAAKLKETLSEEEMFQLLGVEDEDDNESTNFYSAYDGLDEYHLEDFLERIYLDNHR